MSKSQILSEKRDLFRNKGEYMTDWQWKVVVALCRLVLNLHKNDQQGIMSIGKEDEHIATLKEAVRIEDGKQS